MEDDVATWERYGHWSIRGDHVQDLPGNRSDLDRAEAQLVYGLRKVFDSGWEFGGAVRGRLSTESNSDAVENLDNEEPDAADLYEFYARYAPSQDGFIEIGRTPLVMVLSPLLWDPDFRPAGIGALKDFEVGQFDLLTFSGGYFLPLHIDEDESRLQGLQVSYRRNAGAPEGWSALLSYVEFDELNEVLADGRTRTNRRLNGALVSDFEIADLQLGYRGVVADFSYQIWLDLAHNFGAEDEENAARLDLILGERGNAGDFAYGFVWQRVQSDAVMAAFNDDDWWFPSRMRGVSAWAEYGFSEQLSGRLSLFRERRDDLSEHLHRVILEFRYQF